MKEFFAKLKEKIDNPSRLFLVLWYIFTVFACTGAILLAVFGLDDPILSIIAYAVFALAAICLAYSVYTVVRVAPKIKRKAVEIIKSNRLGKRLLEDYGFKTLATAGFSTLVNVAYIIFNLVLSILLRSFWYGSLALYYALLVVLRGGLVFFRGKNTDQNSVDRVHVRKYRSCGIILTVLPLCLVVPILQIIFLNRAFVYYDWTVFAFAFYAFYKIIDSTINALKSRKQDDATVEAVRCVGLADAMVSVFSLQTALLFSFGESGTYTAANVITGCAVCVLTVALGVFMIINSKRKMDEIRRREWQKICEENQLKNADNSQNETNA